MADTVTLAWRAVAIVACLSACAEPQQQVKLDHPSPEPSSFLVERACPDPETRLDSYITEEGHVQGVCVPVEQAGRP